MDRQNGALEALVHIHFAELLRLAEYRGWSLRSANFV